MLPLHIRVKICACSSSRYRKQNSSLPCHGPLIFLPMCWNPFDSSLFLSITPLPMQQSCISLHGWKALTWPCCWVKQCILTKYVIARKASYVFTHHCTIKSLGTWTLLAEQLCSPLKTNVLVMRGSGGLCEQFSFCVWSEMSFPSFQQYLGTGHQWLVVNGSQATATAILLLFVV